MNELLKKSVEFGYGIRILNQDPFEMLISFIISARNSIPSIMKTIKKISERWGDKIDIYNLDPELVQSSKPPFQESDNGKFTPTGNYFNYILYILKNML